MATTITTLLNHLECTGCGNKLPADVPQNLCPTCGKVLFARYDLAGMKAQLDRGDLSRRSPTMWRYRELLPVGDPDAVVTLGEGMTPLLPASRLARRFGLDSVLVKEEGLNPTGTFKARGISAAVSKARELGIRSIVMPSAGNAGAALAAYGRRAGIDVHVVIPSDTPETIRMEILFYGAHVYEVDGVINVAGRHARALRQEHQDWFDLSTLKEPYRLEGKKTMGFEIAEQMGWDVPDVVVYPTGGGTGLVGIWKALAELEALGWIGNRRPRMVVVQADGCAPIVRAFRDGAATATPWENPSTLAAGLRVPEAVGDYLMLGVVRESGGAAVTVSDKEILHAMRQFAQEEGIMACPEGGATLAAIPQLLDSGIVRPGERVVLMNTGSGLNYIEAVRQAVA